jgi:glycopeptide antibiotics resistance protein
MRPRRGRALLVVATAAYVVVLWWMTLRPVAYGEDVAGVVDAVVAAFAAWAPTAWVTFPVVEFSANVALFVPWGLVAMAWRAPWWAAVAGGLIASILIETAQLLWLPARVADVRDLVANTLGAAIGAAVFVAVRRVARARAYPSERSVSP